jgi:hypothetical protein
MSAWWLFKVASILFAAVVAPSMTMVVGWWAFAFTAVGFFYWFVADLFVRPSAQPAEKEPKR